MWLVAFRITIGIDSGGDSILFILQSDTIRILFCYKQGWNVHFSLLHMPFLPTLQQSNKKTHTLLRIIISVIFSHSKSIAKQMLKQLFEYIKNAKSRINHSSGIIDTSCAEWRLLYEECLDFINEFGFEFDMSR